MKRQNKLMLRYRPNTNESIESRHKRFLSRQVALPVPWCILDQCCETPPAIAGKLTSVVDLDKCMTKGIRGHIVYSFRGPDYLKDDARCDDYMVMEFDPDKVDYSGLISDSFPKMVEAFECYSACIEKRDVVIRDFDKGVLEYERTGKEPNGRNTVFRINAVNFWDRELCKRAFRLSPADIVKRLTGEVESVSEFYDGVLLIVTSQILTTEEHEAIDARVRKLLRHKLFGFF